MVVARGRAALRGCMPSFARTRRPRSRRVEAEKSAMLCGIARSTTPDEVRRFTPGPEVPPGGATRSETPDGRVDDFWAWTHRRSTRRRGDARPRSRIQRLCRARAVRGTSRTCLWAGRAWNPSVADHDRGGAPGAVLGQHSAGQRAAALGLEAKPRELRAPCAMPVDSVRQQSAAAPRRPRRSASARSGRSADWAARQPRTPAEAAPRRRRGLRVES